MELSDLLNNLGKITNFTKDDFRGFKKVPIAETSHIYIWYNMLLFNIFYFECTKIDFTPDFPKN